PITLSQSWSPTAIVEVMEASIAARAFSNPVVHLRAFLQDWTRTGHSRQGIHSISPLSWDRAVAAFFPPQFSGTSRVEPRICPRERTRIEGLSPELRTQSRTSYPLLRSGSYPSSPQWR